MEQKGKMTPVVTAACLFPAHHNQLLSPRLKGPIRFTYPFLYLRHAHLYLWVPADVSSDIVNLQAVTTQTPQASCSATCRPAWKFALWVFLPWTRVCYSFSHLMQTEKRKKKLTQRKMEEFENFDSFRTGSGWLVFNVLHTIALCCSKNSVDITPMVWLLLHSPGLLSRLFPVPQKPAGRG